MSVRNIFGHPSGWLMHAGCFFLPLFSLAQSFDWRSKVDQVIQMADSLSMVSQQTFHINKFVNKDRPVRETWHYTLFNGKVIIFEVHYFVDSTEYQQVFYLDHERVVCIEEYEILYPEKRDDQIIWGSVSFFQNQALIQYVTMGRHEQREDELPEYTKLALFQNRWKELLENRPLLEKNSKASIFVK
jgi:hypothetical protein